MTGWDYDALASLDDGWVPPDLGGLVAVGDPWSEPEAETGYWAWVEVEREDVTPVVWTRWLTAGDGRVCPVCGPLDWLTWEEDDGPQPPQHPNCRCVRAYAFTEWRSRPVTTWEERWID